MTTLLQFKQGDSGTTLSLNAITTGFQLEEDGWYPVVATPVHMGDPSPVLETLSLLLSNTSYDNIATNMQSLHEMQVLANRYINDPTQENPVWLHAQMDGETGERRALVRSITIQYKPTWFGAGESTLNIPLVLTVMRGPFWERTTARDLPDSGSKSGAVVVYDYTAAGAVVSAHDIVGDVGARIRFFELLNNTFEFFSYWMGIRSVNKRGSTGISNFDPIWEIEDGNNYTDCTDTSDSSASGGSKVRITESGVDWDDGSFHDVAFIDLDNITSNPEDQLGNYLWILRAKISSGTDTWEVRLKYFGGGSLNSPILKNPVEVDNTGWQYYEMNVMSIPSYSPQIILDTDFDTSNIDNFGLMVQARRTSGTTSSLDLDCLCLIAVDEGFIKLTNPGNGNNYTEMWGQSPHGRVDYIRRDNLNELLGFGTVDSFSNFTLPPGDGRIYCVYTATPSDLTDTIVFNDGDTGKYYEQWLSLRGSE